MTLSSLSFVRFYGQTYASITDFFFYRTILAQPLRRTFLYLLYLAAHMSIILTLAYAWQVGPSFKWLFQWAREALPPFGVEDGELWVEAEQPLIRVYPGSNLNGPSGQITFVFDTTGTYHNALQWDEPVVLLTREKMDLRIEGQTFPYWWKDTDSFRLSKREWEQLESLVKWIYFPVAYSLWLTYALIAHFFCALLLVPLALSASMIRHGTRLPLSHCFNITSYCLTPAVVICVGVSLTGLQINPLIYLTIAAIYSYLSTQKCIATE